MGAPVLQERDAARSELELLLGELNGRLAGSPFLVRQTSKLRHGGQGPRLPAQLSYMLGHGAKASEGRMCCFLLRCNIEGKRGQGPRAV